MTDSKKPEELDSEALDDVRGGNALQRMQQNITLDNGIKRSANITLDNGIKRGVVFEPNDKN